MIWDTVWDVFSNIFGFISIIGPLLLSGWAWQGIKVKLKSLNEPN